MKSLLLIVLPALLGLSGCSDEMQVHDQSVTQASEIDATDETEAAGAGYEMEARDIELRDPVGLD